MAENSFDAGKDLGKRRDTLQSLTGKYRGLQGNPCNENRDPAMRTGVPCNENRFFPVGIGSQGVPCELYRVWVCSASNYCTVRVAKTFIYTCNVTHEDFWIVNKATLHCTVISNVYHVGHTDTT